MIRELRPRRRTRITDTESDESTDEADADGAAQIPQSSIEDLISPADVSTFDQTFTDESAELDIEGEYEPVAGTKQVIPRIAYVLSYQLVYNPEQERWEPDEGNESGGGASRSTTLEKTSTQTLPNSGSFTEVTFGQLGTNTLDAGGVSTNSITVPADADYRCSALCTYGQVDPDADLDTQLEVNGNREAITQDTAPGSSPQGGFSQSPTKVLPLSAGDTITLGASAQNTTGTTVTGDPVETYLTVTKLT
jgi:hypothetical protein